MPKEDFIRAYATVFRSTLPLLPDAGHDESAQHSFLHHLFIRILFLQFLSQSQTHPIQNGIPTNVLTLWDKYSASKVTKEQFYTDYLLPLLHRHLPCSPQINNQAIPDAVFHDLFENLLHPYRFTLAESESDSANAIDPEILGAVFEKLIQPGERQRKGTFYTPRLIVAYMCRESLKISLTRLLPESSSAITQLIDNADASALSVSEAETLYAYLKALRIIDPSCGSGAYLLGMLQTLQDASRLLAERIGEAQPCSPFTHKFRILRHNLHGVDIDPFAAEITRMRLWLCLLADAPSEIPLLPNLDFKIQTGGDSITAPSPHSLPSHHARTLSALKDEYFSATGEDKAALYAAIQREQKTVASLFPVPIPTDAFDWSIRFIEVFTPNNNAPAGFDIAITNPPYGTSVDNTTRFRHFPRPANGTISRDAYGIFLARGLELLRPGGTLCFLISNTWRTIRSFLPLRERLLQQTTVQHLLDLPNWIFDAAVNTGIITLTNSPAPSDSQIIAGDLTHLPRGDWPNLKANLQQIDSDTAYTYPQAIIPAHANRSFFIASPQMYTLFSDSRFQPLGAIADIKAGLQTGDNTRYLRKQKDARGPYPILDETQLLTDTEIAQFSDGEKRNGIPPAHYNGRCFVPYDKGGSSDAPGGWLPNYYVPTEYFIDWSESAVQRMNTHPSEKTNGKLAARFQNSAYYFRQGITWSDVGFYSPTVRLSGIGVFDVKGSRLIPHSAPTELILGVLCSKLGRYTLKCLYNHTVSTQVDDVRSMPFPKEPDAAIVKQICVLVNTIIEKQRISPRYPYHFYEQREIDTLIYQLYGLEETHVREITLWYRRRYPELARVQENDPHADTLFGIS